MRAHQVILSAVVFGLLGLGGCDQSKGELQQTKATLASVTAERDNLKMQLDQANQRNTQLQQQVADLQAKLQAQPAAAAPGTTGGNTAKNGRGRTPPATKRPAPTPAQKQQIEQVEKKANTGGGHF
jgi:hypothetical protein